MLHQKNMAHVLAIDLGNTAALPLGVEIRYELMNNPRNQAFELVVPSILLSVAEALSIDDPAHISDPMRPENICHLTTGGFAKQALDSLHAGDEFHASGRREFLKHGVSLGFGESVKLFE